MTTMKLKSGETVYFMDSIEEGYDLFCQILRDNDFTAEPSQENYVFEFEPAGDEDIRTIIAWADRFMTEYHACRAEAHWDEKRDEICLK